VALFSWTHALLLHTPSYSRMNSTQSATDDRVPIGGGALAAPLVGKEDPETKSVVDARLSLWASGCAVAAATVVTLLLLLSYSLKTWHLERSIRGIDGMPVLDKPIGDSRTYHFSRLDNGLEVLNIHDPEAVTAAYSMAVEAGSWDDPRKIPGLAHFCEHMVFLGSEKFPEASGYDKFVNSHGGYLNAYTAEQATVYFTELSGGGFDEGLARFADFLQAPRFDEEYMAKEVNAINSEHAKNVQDPGWRVNAVMNSLANPLSPMSRFHTGDEETLQKSISVSNLQSSLRTWFNAHYCPSRMHLVTLSSETEAQQLEQAKLAFGNMSTGSLICQGDVETWASPEPWPESQLGRWVTVLGTQPQPSMLLHFPMPDLTKEFLSQPTSYLQYVLTYGGEDSHLTLLRDDLGLISGFSIGFQMSSAGGALIAEYSLSELGLQHPGLVIDVFFQYVSTLRSSSVDRDLYASLANVTKLEWDWSPHASPADTASGLAERMTRLPPESLLSGDSIIKVPDPALVADLLTLLTPDNMNALLVTPDAEERFGSSHVHTLAHYDVKFATTKLADQFPESYMLWSKWLSASGAEDSKQELSLRLQEVQPGKPLMIQIPEPPEPISNVPKSIDTQHMHADRPEIPGDFDTSLFGRRPEPLSLQEDQGNNSKANGKAASGTAVSFATNGTATSAASGKTPVANNMSTWYRAGWVTTSPKVKLNVALRPWRTQEQWEPPVEEGLRLQLYSALLGERMAPKLFDDAVVGGDYNLKFSGNGIHLGFTSFPTELAKLVDHTLAETMQGVNGTSLSQFQRVQHDMVEGLKSYSEMPVHYAIEDRGLLLTTGTHSKEESLPALEKLDLPAVLSASAELLKDPLELTALVVGNLEKSQGQEVLATTVAGLQNMSVKVGQGTGELMLVTPVVDPGRPLELRKQNPRADDPNDVAVVTLLDGVSTVESRVLYGILGQILSQLAYDELRTEKQLGYVVSAGELQISNIQAVSIVVQGTALDADSMEAAIEHVYFQSMPKLLANLTDEDFQSYKAALKHQLLEPPLNIGEEFSHWWSLVSMHGACLGLRNEMLTYLEKFVESKKQLVEAWSKLVLPASGARKKVAVKYFAKQVPPRASKEEADELFKQFGLQGQDLAVLARERNLSAVQRRADSAARAELARLGGYFPRTLHCEMSKESKEALPKAAKETLKKGDQKEDGDEPQLGDDQKEDEAAFAASVEALLDAAPPVAAEAPQRKKKALRSGGGGGSGGVEKVLAPATS